MSQYHHSSFMKKMKRVHEQLSISANLENPINALCSDRMAMSDTSFYIVQM